MNIEITEEMREALARYYRATSDSLTPDKAVASEAMERASKASMDLTHLVAEAVEAEEGKAPDAMHVTVHMGTGRLVCARCGASARVALPCFVQDFRAHLTGFCREHAECKVKGGGDV